MAAEVEAAGGALGTADRLDGLTVDRGDWWFNLRPSNTEPLLRLNVEAPDAGGLRGTGRRGAGRHRPVGRRLIDAKPDTTVHTGRPRNDRAERSTTMTLDPL